jgi:hypothetical protein
VKSKLFSSLLLCGLMPNVYKPFLLQIRPQYTDEGVDVAENILWFLGSVDSAYSRAQLTAIQLAFDTAWPDVWLTVGSTTGQYRSCFVSDWTSNTGIVLPPVVGSETTGTEGQAIGVNTAALVSWGTAVRYRGGHSRSYLPAVGTDAITLGTQMTTAANTALVAALSAFNLAMLDVGDGDGGPLLQVVYRFKSDAIKAETMPITFATAQLQLASQRRRLRKVSRR